MNDDNASFIFGAFFACLITIAAYVMGFAINNLHWFDGQRLKVLRSHITHIEKYEPCNPHNAKGLDDAMGVDCAEIHRARSKQ